MFESREEAAKKLTLKILPKIKGKDAVVIALVRGAVVMGKIISGYLSLAFDILVVRKIGSPFSPELAIGAVAGKNIVFWNEDIVKELRLSKKELKKLQKSAEKERASLEKILRKGKKSINPKEKTIIIVDDGVATGATVLAANSYFQKQGAEKVILATPVISKETYKNLKKEFAAIIALKKPSDFYAVGQFYRHFPQLTNEDVTEILNS